MLFLLPLWHSGADLMAKMAHIHAHRAVSSCHNEGIWNPNEREVSVENHLKGIASIGANAPEAAIIVVEE